MRRILCFTEGWCGPCRRLNKEYLDLILDKVPDGIEFVFPSKGYPSYNQIKIKALPTVVFLEDEKEIHRFEGQGPRPAISWVVSWLNGEEVTQIDRSC